MVSAIGNLIVLGFCSAWAFAQQAEAAAASDAVGLVFEQISRERRSLSPQAMSAALLGTPLESDYLGRLDIPSVASTEAALAMARRHRRMLDSFDRQALNDADRLSYDIMIWQLDQEIAGARFVWHDFPVNQLMAIHNTLPGFMTAQHPLRTDADVEFYLDRLAQFPAAFEGTVAVLEHRAGRGLLPPRFAVEKTLRDSRAFIDGKAVDNPLVSEILARADRTGVLSESRRATLEPDLIAALDQYVIPAYRTLIDALEDMLERAETNDGVWRLPDGDAYYRWVLRGHTTTALSPAEIHSLGLREVERIEAEMGDILCAQTYCRGTVGERMAALNTEERFLFEDSRAGRQAILDAYRAIVAEAGEVLDEWFHEGPSYALEVRQVPEYRQATAFGAYYSQGVPDGSRPGVFYVNLRSVAEHPRYGLRTLAYHEAIPGHHLQISRMQVMADVPDFRRSVRLHAHAEGWALYAEGLAWEMGLHRDPFDNLGRLQAELFRAARLVVDTGMHHARWSREQGIEYLHGVTGMPLSDVEAEIERYLVMPGQACSFKVGMLRIQAMRRRAEQVLGDRFDVRDFHHLVLDSGAMPLELLDRVVDDWVASVGRESL